MNNIIPSLSVKEYLSRAFHIDRRIDSMLEQVASLRSLATKASSNLSDMPRSSSPNLQTMESIIAKIVDLQADINADIDRLVDLKCELRAAINAVADPELQTLLELRYLCFKTWEQIAVSMDRDLRWLFRLHARALAAVKKNLADVSKSH